jgi:excisionase family DNA binding protein
VRQRATHSMCMARRFIGLMLQLLAGGCRRRKVNYELGCFSPKVHHRRHRRHQNTRRADVPLRASFPENALGVLSRFDGITNRVSMSTSFNESAADDWISQAEAARLRGVTRQAVARLIKRQRVATLKIGGRLLIKRKDIEEFKPDKGGRPPK